MNNILNDYNIIFIYRVDENVRINSFKTKTISSVNKEEFEDGYYIMAGKDENLNTVHFLKEVNDSDSVVYAQPLIGPILKLEEAKNVGNEFAYILESNPGISISHALVIWDHQFNLTNEEEEQNFSSLN